MVRKKEGSGTGLGSCRGSGEERNNSSEHMANITDECVLRDYGTWGEQIMYTYKTIKLGELKRQLTSRKVENHNKGSIVIITLFFEQQGLFTQSKYKS